MELKAILDTCPKVEKMVDWRRCQRCEHYQAKLETPFASVECEHPEAKHDPKPETWEAMKAMKGVLHVTCCGPMRSE